MIFAVIAISDESIAFLVPERLEHGRNEKLRNSLSCSFLKGDGNFNWQCHESGVRERLRKLPLGRFIENGSRFGSGSRWRDCYRCLISRNNLN